MFELKIENETELYFKLKKIMGSMAADMVEPILLEGAVQFRDELKRIAPLGPTGNLKRSPVAKILRRLEGNPAAIGAIDRKIAPHAHLIEYGTEGARYPTEKARKIKPGGYWIWRGHRITNTGILKPYPFFQLLAETRGYTIQKEIAGKIQKLIEENTK